MSIEIFYEAVSKLSGDECPCRKHVYLRVGVP
jgi:hypothetical protein